MGNTCFNFLSLPLLHTFPARHSAKHIACIISFNSSSQPYELYFVILTLPMKKLSPAALSFLSLALSFWSHDVRKSQCGSNTSASEYFTYSDWYSWVPWCDIIFTGEWIKSLNSFMEAARHLQNDSDLCSQLALFEFVC